MAETLGCYGEYVDKAEGIRPALERAQKKVDDGIVALVNVRTDYRARRDDDAVRAVLDLRTPLQCISAASSSSSSTATDFSSFPGSSRRQRSLRYARRPLGSRRSRRRPSSASTPAACARSSACTRRTAQRAQGPFRALVRTPRVLGPVRQALGTDEVYIYHTKINTKPAIEGTVWMWHQDYGSWMRDGCPRPDMGTFAVMLTDSSEMNGALYVIPGSHKRGRIEPYYDENTVLQVLGRAEEGDHRGPAGFSSARSGRGTGGNRGRLPLQSAACLRAQPVRRGPLAHLHLVQRMRERAEDHCGIARRLGGVEEYRAAADRGRRRHPEGSLTAKDLAEDVRRPRLERCSVLTSLEKAVDAILERTGDRVACATPLGLGKPAPPAECAVPARQGQNRSDTCRS
jgi:hypothetical protein